jgi:hypothetical protein
MSGAVPPRWLPIAVALAVVAGVLLALWTFGLATTGA